MRVNSRYISQKNVMINHHIFLSFIFFIGGIEMSKRSKRYEVLFTDEEWKKIQNAKKHFRIKDTSTYVRRKVLEGSVVIEDIQGKTEIIKEINAIGNNINQTVHALNKIAMKSTASRKDIVEVKFLAQLIRNDQEKIVQIIKDKLFAKYIKEEGEE